jgi:hypothetical protein
MTQTLLPLVPPWVSATLITQLMPVSPSPLLLKQHLTSRLTSLVLL